MSTLTDGEVQLARSILPVAEQLEQEARGRLAAAATGADADHVERVVVRLRELGVFARRAERVVCA